MRRLAELAAQYRDGVWDEASEAEFARLVGAETDVEGLRQLAEDYAPFTGVSAPALSRIVELNPADVDALVVLGWVRWLDGEDEQGREYLGRAKRLAPEHVEVLTLEAALATEPAAKLSLYRKVLSQDPTNRVALGKLEELKSQGVE
jgi:hypothetical protein